MLVGDAAHKHRAADAGGCPPTPRAQAGSQLVRVTLQGQQDPLRNQTAVVDKARSTVTYYVTSQSNLSAVVLYDSRNVSAGASLPPQLLFAAFLCTFRRGTQSRGKENVRVRGFLGQGWVCAACSKGHVCPQGYVCYKPLQQRACYLRRMDPWDLQTLQMALNTSEHSVSSCCSIPGMSGGWTELCTGSLNVLLCGFAGVTLPQSIQGRALPAGQSSGSPCSEGFIAHRSRAVPPGWALSQL